MSATKLDSLLTFLRGSKIGERLHADLARDLYVPTSVGDDYWVLEDAILGALREGRHVVIAGSAGGGKTTLINMLRPRAEEQGLHFITPEPKKWKEAVDRPAHAVAVIPDLTAIARSKRRSAVEQLANSGPLLLAANEGVLHRANLTPPFDHVLRDLHDLQRGHRLNRFDAPVVVDLAGVNPLKESLPLLLRNALLHEAVTENELHPEPGTPRRGCGEDPEFCPRLRALELLTHQEVAQALSELVQLAVGPQETTYRQLWEFIGDLFLNGECDHRVPSSVWFWRAFFGQSLLAEATRRRFPPTLFAFPRVEADLYFGDWERVRDTVDSNLPFIESDYAPNVLAEDSADAMAWLKAEMVFLNAASGPGLRQGLSRAEFGLPAAVMAENVVPILQAMNAYFRMQNARAADPEELELWGDLSLSRRMERPRGLFRLAKIPAQHFMLRRSQIVANLDVEDVRGSRVLLVAHALSSTSSETEHSMSIDSRFIEAMARGRATRTADRSNDDVDWAMWMFFSQIVDSLDPALMSELATISFERSQITPEVTAWRIDEDGAVLRVAP